MFVFVPRAVTFALMAFMFKKENEKWIFAVYILGSVSLIWIAVKIGSLKWPAKMPSIYKWNSEIKYIDVGIKGEYEESKQRGFEEYIRETKLKAIFLSVFLPCIVISRRFHVFEITAVISTFSHLIGCITGIVLCETDSSFCLSQIDINHETYYSTPSPVQEDGKQDFLKFMFPINMGLLVLSCFALLFLTRLSEMFYLRRKMFGKFQHPCLVGRCIELEAEREYAMEKEAKQLAPAWQKELSQLRQKATSNHASDSSLLSKMCNDIGGLENAIIIRRKAKSTTMTTALQMLKNLRFGEDHIGGILANIHLHNITKPTSTNPSPSIDQEREIHGVLYHENINQLYQNIQTEEHNIDDENEDGDTGLITAVKEENYIATNLLLVEGASVVHRNHDKETAFDIAIRKDNPEMKQLLWSFIQQQDEQDEVFYNFCGMGNLKGVEYCLENSTNKERQSLIEFNQNEKKLFPLLTSLIFQKEEVALLLVKHHRELNEHFLMTCEVNNTNALMYASQFGLINIVNAIIDIYDKNKKVTETNNVGRNSLMAAAAFEEEEIVKILLPIYERENKIHHKDNVGKTFLDYARQNNNENIINLLEQYV